MDKFIPIIFFAMQMWLGMYMIDFNSKRLFLLENYQGKTKLRPFYKKRFLWYWFCLDLFIKG